MEACKTEEKLGCDRTVRTGAFGSTVLARTLAARSFFRSVASSVPSSSSSLSLSLKSSSNLSDSSANQRKTGRIAPENSGERMGVKDRAMKDAEHCLCRHGTMARSRHFCAVRYDCVQLEVGQNPLLSTCQCSCRTRVCRHE